MGLTKEQILAADDRPIEQVHVPEWGGCVFVRSMTGNERDRMDVTFAGSREQPERAVGLRASVVAACLCTEEGEPLEFTPEELRELGSKKSAAVIERVFDVAQRLSGLSQEDVEELEKN